MPFPRNNAAKIARLNALSEVDRAEFAPVISSAKLGWRGFGIERHRVKEDSFTGEICFPRHIIGFLLAGNYRKDVRVGAARRTVAHYPGQALLYQAGLPHVGHGFAEADFAVLYFEPEFIRRTAREIVVGEQFEIVSQPQFQDRFVADAVGHLLTEVEAGGATGRLYAESLMTALAAKLIKDYSTAKIAAAHAFKGGLAPHKMRNVAEFVRANLSEDISISDLARICQMNFYHFARQFKQSAGIAPYQYVLRQRVERAKELLRTTDLPLAEIALQSGFADQNHFTRVFSRLVQATPKFYRDNR